MIKNSRIKALIFGILIAGMVFAGILWMLMVQGADISGDYQGAVFAAADTCEMPVVHKNAGGHRAV